MIFMNQWLKLINLLNELLQLENLVDHATPELTKDIHNKKLFHMEASLQILSIQFNKSPQLHKMNNKNASLLNNIGGLCFVGKDLMIICF